MHTNTNTEDRSTLATLRALIPNRQLQFAEALRVAELHANRLLELSAMYDAPIPNDVISQLPRVRIEYRHLPTSGLSFWDGRYWVICLNAAEPRTRQRFTLLHEYKHIIDHGHTDQLYIGHGRSSTEQQAEQAADYFAGCALMPKRLVKRAWGNGVQRPTALAALFNVSPRAMDVRLSQLGLTEERTRCSRPAASPTPRPHGRRYYRQLSDQSPVHYKMQGAAA